MPTSPCRWTASWPRRAPIPNRGSEASTSFKPGERDPVDTEILERATAATGAVVMGRRLFDVVDAPNVWTKDMAYGDGQVVIMGGGDVIGQAIEKGLMDELHLHLAPMLLGGGTPLFRAGTRQTFRQRHVRPSSNAFHLIYERL